MFKKRYSLAIIAIVLLLASVFIHLFNKSDNSAQCRKVQERLDTKIGYADSLVRKYSNWEREGFHSGKEQQELLQAFTENYTGLFVLEKDTLIFWNTSQVPVTTARMKALKNEGLVHLRNGWYYFKKVIKPQSTRELAVFIFVKPDYDLQNNYLRNRFCAWTGLPESARLDTVQTETDKSIVDGNGQFLFQLDIQADTFDQNGSQSLSLFFLIAAFIVFMIGIVKWSSRFQPLMFVAFWVALFVFYAGCLYFRVPGYIYETEWFNIRRFANADSFFNAYLGQIVFNSVLVLAFSVAWYKWVKTIRSAIWIVSVFNLAFVGLILLWLDQLLKSLINNSTLSFDFLNLFNTTPLTYIGIAALVLINLSLCVFSISLYNITRRFWLFALMALLAAGWMYLVKGQFSVHVYWGPLLMLLLYGLRYFNVQVNALSVGYIVLYLSVCNSTILSRYIDAHNSKNLEVLSFQLTERQDPILESEFAAIPEQMKTDNRLRNLISILPVSEAETPALIRQKYFSGYFEHYNIELALFDKDCRPLLPNTNAVYRNEGFFTDQIAYNSQTPISEHLFFIDKYKQNARYVAKVELKDTRLFILMEPKQFEEIGSFPDLLLDQSQQKQAKLQSFSYAVYRNNQLTNRYGSFNYPYLKPDSSLLSFSGNYTHNSYNTDEDTEVIISSPRKEWRYLFTYNSYVFLFFSVLTFLVYVFYALVFKPISGSISLTQRIQAIIIILLLLAIASIAISSTQLIRNQFTADNTKLLQEKSQSVLNDVLPLLQSEESLSEEQKDLINLTLKKNARLFSCDVSLFDAKGFLYTTSQSRLYDLGLASVLANPEALQMLKSYKGANYCVSDKAGTLEFLSLYTPLYNTRNVLLGYLNLPYFARQNELVSRLSTIMSTLINLYVILFVISVLSALVLSGYITKPLRLIKQQIANISLNKRNEPIQWQSNDEIGRLVTEYNGMIAKLEESAGLLAKSERETAWREMAKQVAHEIKNPLTPMKLNLQYLQHIINGNPEDFKEKFQKASASIIEQIDTLASIATEFSHFAKLPSAKIERIDLTEILTLSIETFKNEPRVYFHNALPTEPLMVKGDKEQALRVFNNIIKNAIQACMEKETAELKIEYYLEEGTVVVGIRDNGCGIDEALKPKLFTPNFTTKSTGSGLGLAMVKNSMESFGGKVWYESETGKGTVFFLQFLSAD